MDLLFKNLIATAVITVLFSIAYFIFKGANTLGKGMNTERDIDQNNYGCQKVFKYCTEIVHSMKRSNRLSDSMIVIDDTTLYCCQGGTDSFELSWNSSILTVNLGVSSLMNINLIKLFDEGTAFPVLIRADTYEVTSNKAIVNKTKNLLSSDQTPTVVWSIHLLDAKTKYIERAN